MKIKFIRFKEDVEIPTRKHYSDTGLDVPMRMSGVIQPFETLVIPLGFGILVPNGYTARLQVRTSLAKEGLFIQNCAIDAGYTGEISLILHNLSQKLYVWKEGDRLGYIEVYPAVYPELVEDLGEERKNNGFGSTGK